MNIVKKSVMPFSFINDDGVEIKAENPKTYVLLAYLYNSDSDDEYTRTFDICVGRESVFDKILHEYLAYNEGVNIFKSVIIAEEGTPKSSISFYSFMRYMLEKSNTMLDEYFLKQLSDEFGIVDVESFDDYVYNTFGLFVEEEEIEDLDVFYKEDLTTSKV